MTLKLNVFRRRQLVEASAELPAHRQSWQPKLTQPGGLHPDGGGQLGVRAGAQPHGVCQEVPSEQLRHVHPAHHRYSIFNENTILK